MPPEPPKPPPEPSPAPAKAALITVVSTPAGASVEIDGVPSGTTPCTVEVPIDGQVRPIALRLRGYQEHVGDLRVTDQLRYAAMLHPRRTWWPVILLGTVVALAAILALTRLAH